MDNIEFILGTLSILFVIFAIYISILAVKNLPIGHLSGYIQTIIYSAIMLTLGYIWHTIRELFDLKEVMGTYIEYPEYIFKIVASILLAVASYRLYKLSKEFRENNRAENKNKSLKYK
jgi:uncharacterized membrane protein